MKLHKEHNPIRPIVYWLNAPAYKLPKFTTKALKTHAPLPYSFNIKNTTYLLKYNKFHLIIIWGWHPLISAIYTPM